MRRTTSKRADVVNVSDDDGLVVDLTDGLPALPEFFHDTDEAVNEATFPSSPSPGSPAVPLRNGPVNLPCIEHQKWADPATGNVVACGSTWKLQKQYRHIGFYLYVRQIVEDASTDEVTLRGLPMYPNKRLGGMLEWGGYAKYNVYMEVKVDRDDERPWHVQGMCEVPVSALASQIPTELVATQYDRSTQIATHLSCRRVFMKVYSNAAHRMSKQPRQMDIESVLHTLSPLLINELKSLEQRQPPVLGGRRTNEHRPWHQQHDRTEYPYTSLFSGLGGDCRGARDAGAKVVLAIDKHTPANKTMRLNFPNTVIHNDSVSNVALYGQQRPCRICHLSPPCQPHSNAHTRAGVNDDENYLASLTCSQAIEALNYPDILTLENVKGLVQMRSSVPWFVTIINQLAETGPGYNVRWKLFDFREYGLVPRRTRFVAVASRRGVPLPAFPKPTHGPAGSRPFATVHQVLTSMHGRPYLSHNEVPGHCRVFNTPHPPYDPHTKVLGCITTSGGEDNLHPSGGRTLTIRELAVLNGIPLDFDFPEIARPGVREGLSKSEIIKQIGNCIPPGVWTVFIKSIIDTLRAYENGDIDADGRAVVDPRPSSEIQTEVIDLDADDEDEHIEQGEWRRAHRQQRMDANASRDSSRTLSPELVPSPPSTKRPMFAPRMTEQVVIDLTDD